MAKLKYAGDIEATGSALLRGNGVAFPAAQSASSDPNTLDDYEEGTFTTSIASTSGTVTLSSNTLRYTKIGRLVHVGGRLVVSAVSSPTGAILIALPFPVGGVSQRAAGAATVDGALSTWTGAPALICGEGSASSAYLGEFVAGSLALAAAKLKAGTIIDLALTYQTD